MKTLIIILLIINIVLILSGCEIEQDCDEYYIHDYEFVTHPDGSVTTGAPIYRCGVPPR